MRRLAIVVMSVLGAMAVVIAVLMAMPGLRYNIFRISIELPQIATYLMIRGPLQKQDFKSAAAGLERQMRISEWLDVERSTLLPGLVENTRFVIDRARIASEYDVLLPHLRKLAERYPSLYLGQLWLGRALSAIDPEQAFAALDAATLLVPADDRPYRFAIDAALALGKPALARTWCQRYDEAQLGGPYPYRYTNIFAGTGIRKMALEVVKSDGDPVFISHEGVQLNEKLIYDFLLSERHDLKRLGLHAGIVSGIRVTFHKISVYAASGRRDLAMDKLAITPMFGYAIGRDTFVTTSTDGEVYSIRLADGAGSDVDRVDFEITFDRLPLTSLAVCNGLPDE